MKGPADEDFYVRPAKPPTRKNKTSRASSRERIRAQKQRERHDALTEENVHVGLMFGSKALIQLIANPMYSNHYVMHN